MKILKWLSIILFLFIAFVAGYAWVNNIKPLSMMKSEVYQVDGRAIDGNDVVAYFADSAAVKGKEEYQSEFNGAVFLFNSDEHKTLFELNPNKYIPQYGGHCSFAVSTGIAAPNDPTIWIIQNDKLYLFSNEEVKQKLLENFEETTKACENKWSKR